VNIKVGINKGIPIAGIVTSRQCPSCGHHEVGIIAHDGSFYPLKPGTLIQFLDGGPAMPDFREVRQQSKESTREDEEARLRPWAPDIIKGHRILRLKYGVMVREDIDTGKIDGGIYRSAFLQKLHSLIEREINIPLAVILDRFFNTPHLASGSSEEIASAMWRELDEVRKPVELVNAWMENQGGDQASSLLNPYSMDDIAGEPVSDDEFSKELDLLSLGQFLELL